MNQDTRERLTPFHADLHTPLLDVGGEVWTLGAAFEGTVALGGTGAGKSSGSGRAIARALLKAGAGACILIAKPGDADTWRAYAREARREHDLVMVDESGRHRFNMLDYASRTIGGPGFEQNLRYLVETMVEATRVASGGSSGGGEDASFFTEGALKWVAYAFPLLRLVEGTLRMGDLYRFISSVPNSLADVNPTTPEEQKLADEWLKGYCAQVLLKAGDIREQEGPNSYAARMIQDFGDLFIDEVAKLSSRTRSSISATLTNMIYPFLSGKMADLFSTDSTFSLADARAGKIIVLDLPVLKYGATGAVAQSLIKYLFGITMQMEKIDERTARPVMLFMDECQFFLSKSDAELLSTARSSKTAVVMMTQDLPSFEAALSKENKAAAEAIFGKFGTRIFHANTSIESNKAASEIIGKVEKFHVTETQVRGTVSGGGANLNDVTHANSGNSGANSSRSRSQSGYMDYEIPPDYFASELRTGGPKNRFKVDAIIVTNGRTWKRTKRHWVQAEFPQR